MEVKGDTAMSDNEQKKVLARNLSRILAERQLSQKEVAKKIGESPQTFNTWCRGIAIPRIGKIQALADYFGIQKSDLLEDKPSDYYYTQETALIAQELLENPGLRTLFDAANDSTPEDLKMAAELLSRLKGTNPDA